MKKLIINLGFILGVSTMVVGCTDYLDSDYLFEERVNIENVFQSKDSVSYTHLTLPTKLEV